MKIVSHISSSTVKKVTYDFSKNLNYSYTVFFGRALHVDEYIDKK